MWLYSIWIDILYVKFYVGRHTPLGIKGVESILEVNSKFSEIYAELNLFAFLIGTRKIYAFKRFEGINLWQREGNAIEELALAYSGRYYDPLTLEMSNDDFNKRLRKVL